jgi:hypothetical protein
MREISALDQTYTKLMNMKNKYVKDANKTGMELQQLASKASTAQESQEHQKAVDSHSTDKVGKLVTAIDTLVSMLQRAGVTSHGTLVTEEAMDHKGEPARVVEAVRRILGASQDLRGQFKDVFEAFAAPTLAQLRGHKEPKEHKKVHMTPELLQRTVSALKQVQKRLRTQQTAAMDQLKEHELALSSVVSSASASAGVLRSEQADSKRKADELTFSIDFTKSVLAMDRDFAQGLKKHASAKALLIAQIREDRARQQKTLKSVMDLLIGGYNVPSLQSLSFIQMESESSPHLAELQTSVETAIHSNKDTHELLMQLTSQLDAAVPVDASSVQNVVTHMNDVIHSVDAQQSRADEVRRRCQAQTTNGQKEAKDLKAMAGLVSSDSIHTKEAIKAATANLKGVAAKSKALRKSESDFQRVSSEALQALKGQSKDRHTMISAVRKAMDVESGAAGAPAKALLQELGEELRSQEAHEESFRREQLSVQEQFEQYVNYYVKLLKERENHYKGSLSSLKLYADEIASHRQAELSASSGEGELNGENEDLCSTILSMYQRQSQRRSALKEELKSIVPQVPSIMVMDSDDSGKDGNVDADAAVMDSEQ